MRRVAEGCGSGGVRKERWFGEGGAARHGQNVGGSGCSEAVMKSGYRAP